jgi:hypothetical protein
MRRGGVLLLMAILLAGCSQAGDTKDMDAKFEKLDYQMAGMETLAAAYGDDLPKATQQYIALVREYKDQLGPAEAKRRLVEKGDELRPFCLPCTATLYDETRKY